MREPTEMTDGELSALRLEPEGGSWCCDLWGLRELSDLGVNAEQRRFESW